MGSGNYLTHSFQSVNSHSASSKSNQRNTGCHILWISASEALFFFFFKGWCLRTQMCLEPRQRPPAAEKIPPESNPARLPADFLGFLRFILCDTEHRMEYQTHSARTLIIRRLFFCFPGTVGLTGSLKMTELHRCTQTLAECCVMLGIAPQLREAR